jgi:hypothetical protein
MEDAQIIHKLDITWAELKCHSMLLSGEVQGIERFSLGLSDGGNISTARKTPVAGEGTPGILGNQTLWLSGSRRLVVKKGDRLIPRSAILPKSAPVSGLSSADNGNVTRALTHQRPKALRVF